MRLSREFCAVGGRDVGWRPLDPLGPNATMGDGNRAVPPGPGTVGTGGLTTEGEMHRLAAWFDARSAPFVATVLFAVAGLGYSLLWAALAHRGWHSYSDLWNSAGLALSVGHGHWAAVYAPPSQLDAPPGFEFLLAPFMVVGHALGLGTTQAEGSSYKAFGLILAPLATVMAASVLFALDAIARRWGFSEARRFALSMVAGLGVVSAAVFWGHPEDCIAVALALWAALAVDRDGKGRLRRAGWLLGVAIACQPLALLAVAPVVARFGWRDLRGAAWRLALPTVAVILPEFVAARARTLHAVVDQPYRPSGESSTPFGHFARARSATGCTAAGRCGQWPPWPPWRWATSCAATAMICPRCSS